MGHSPGAGDTGGRACGEIARFLDAMVVGIAVDVAWASSTTARSPVWSHILDLEVWLIGPRDDGGGVVVSTRDQDLRARWPKVWTWKGPGPGRFGNINRPTAGPTHERELPVGRHPLQLYSLGTPNGVKVTILLEELLALGHRGAEYDAWLIRIDQGEQFGSGFVSVNPNSKIPALVDRSGPEPIRVFESGAILLYLAEKFGAFLPSDSSARAECLSWLFWQVGSAPYVGGGFGHFYAYAPEAIEYAVDRYAMETKRLLDVLDRRLAEHPYVAGRDYTIADMAIFPWYGGLVLGWLYEAAEFLSVHEYRHVRRWAERLLDRPAVRRGRMVNRTFGEPSSQLRERHDASDFETRTQDKLGEDSAS